MAENYWIQVQKKSFSRWCNTVLNKRSIEIKELENDFKDGRNLIQLLEILTSKSIKYNKNPRIDVQKMENLTVALKFLKDEGVHLVNIGPNDIHDGNLKLILGLIWALILHFKIKAGSTSDDGANKELLDWVNRHIPTYNIKNFTSDWQSGKAICALAESLLPGQMKLPQDFKNDPIADCTLGVHNAQQHMNIPPIVDVEDIVQHPDQLAMMTYISYFRDYENLNNNQKEKAKELTPDITKCIVYGAGLEVGNDQGAETYFTIEVRNVFDRKVPCGGHDIHVKITGPHSQSAFQAHDNLDGSYHVTYNPAEDGNYVVEVKLGDLPISKSPFHVHINATKGQIVTEPEAHWFVRDPTTKKLSPYDDPISQSIEQQWMTWGGGNVLILDGTYKVDLSTKEEINLNKKNLLGHHDRRPISRATWFWQGDDLEWQPYTEELSVRLEQAFKAGLFDKGMVDISEPKKIRHVQKTETGYKQFRKKDDANKEGRAVQRGYKGRVIEKELPKTPRK